MKLAEALAERADLDKKIAQLRERAKSAARYAEGEEPPESAFQLMTDTRTLLAHRMELIRRINLTNAETRLDRGDGHVISMTGALALRDFLNAERNLLNEVADEASPGRDPYSRRRRTELAEKTDLPVAILRTEADNLSRRFRELDTQIQQANWNTELVPEI
jgi:hypothetical protein